MKYRFVVHHLESNKIWHGKFATMSKTILEENRTFMKQVVTEATYLALELEEDGDEIFIPKEVLKDCVFFIESDGWDE